MIEIISIGIVCDDSRNMMRHVIIYCNSQHNPQFDAPVCLQIQYENTEIEADTTSTYLNQTE